MAEVLRPEAGGGKPIDDPDQFLEEEMDIDADALAEYDEPPECLR